MVRPAALVPGARVELIAPAGPLPPGGYERALERVASLGWEPIPGRYARARSGYLAGSDDQRLADLDHALRSPDNDAIWCLRGGYGTMRILPRVDLRHLRERPRPLIGFSDNTALHLHAQRAGIVTYHGPHPAAKELSDFSLDFLGELLRGHASPGILPFPAGHPPAEAIVDGTATGPLIGGNLSLLAATVGTPLQMGAAGGILFLEEVGEAIYRVDRLLTQLLLSGTLDQIAGVAVGAFNESPDDGDPELPPLLELIHDRLSPLGVPVVAGFPFGHVADNWTLPLGVRARLDAAAGSLELLEAAVEG